MTPTILCPKCGRKNPADAAFCCGCAKPLEQNLSGSVGPSIGDGATNNTGGRAGLEPASESTPPDTAQKAPPSEAPEPQTPSPEGQAAHRKTVKVQIKPGLNSGAQPRAPIKRTPYATLCDKFAGRPYLALLGSGEPPAGYPLRHCVISLGRGQDNLITIREDQISRAHALFAAVGRDFLVIDLRSRHGTFVNGRKLTQATLRRGDVIDVGGARLVYATVPGADVPWGYELCPLWSDAASQPDAAEPEGQEGQVHRGEVVGTAEADEKHGAQVVLRETADGRRVTSEGEPILIGRHEACLMQLEHAGVETFHAQLYWGDDGIHLRDLGSASGTLVQGAPIRDAVLQPGSEVSVGAAKLTMESFGDVAARCRQLATEHGQPRPLALTCVSGAAQGVSGVLPATDRRVVLGRSSKCDLYVHDTRVSTRHASLLARGDRIDIKDLGSHNGVHVNGKQVRSAKLNVGDVLLVGKSEFVVHYAV